MTDTVATETYAVAYAGPTAEGMTPQVDLIHQEVERSEEGTQLSRDEAGNDQAAAEWGTDAADDALAAAGWRRDGQWEWQSDIAGVEAWTCPVVRR